MSTTTPPNDPVPPRLSLDQGSPQITMPSTIQVVPPTPITPSAQMYSAAGGNAGTGPASRVPSTTILHVPSVEGNLHNAASGSYPYHTNTASARTSYTRVGEDNNDNLMDEDERDRDGDEDDERGDSSGSPSRAEEEAQPETLSSPMATLTFLLMSTRRKTMSFPPETAIGRVKELVWNAWPTEWEDSDKKPMSPANIRFLCMGKMLQDEDTLEQLNFSLTTPTIVHISIRPIAVPSPDDYTKKKWIGSSRREHRAEGEETNGVGCCGGCIIC